MMYTKWKICYIIWFVAICFFPGTPSYSDTVSDTYYYSGSFGVRGIAVDEKGDVVVADIPRYGPGNTSAQELGEDRHVLVYDKDGVKTGDILNVGAGLPVDVAVDQKGRIYVAESWFNGHIGIYDRSGNLIKSVGGRGLSPGQFPSGMKGKEDFNSPYSVAVGTDGSIYAVEASFINKVYKYDSQGVYNLTISCPDTPDGMFKFNPHNLNQVRVNPKDNTVYILEESGIYVFDSNGKFLRKLPVNNYITFDTEGNPISANGGDVNLLDQHGNSVKQILQLPFQIKAITAGSNGNLYIVPESTEIAYQVYSPERKLIFEQKADIEKLEVTLSYGQLESGEKVPVRVKFISRQEKGLGSVGNVTHGTLADKKTLSVFAKEYRASADWRDVPINPSDKPGDYVLHIPDDMWGLYTLRFVPSADPEPVARKQVHCDFIVGITPADGVGALTIFTDRNRKVYQCGEEIEFNLGIRVIKDIKTARVTILLKSEDNAVWSIQLPIENFPSGNRTFTFIIPGEATRFLKPQAYTISAEAEGVKLKNGYKEVVLTPEVADTRFQKIVHDIFRLITFEPVKETAFLGKLGFNRIIFTNPQTQLPVPSYNETARKILAVNPKLPMAEESYIKSVPDAYMEEGLLHGIKIQLQPFMHYTNFPCLPEDQPIVQTHLARLTQSLSRYPSFAGFNYHDIFWLFHEDSTRWSKIITNFEQRFGLKQPTPSEVSQVREDKGSEDIIKKTLTWTDYLTNLYPDAYTRWNEAVKGVHPGLITTVSPWAEQSAKSGVYHPKLHALMDEVITNYPEEQYYETFLFPHQVDFSRRPGKNVLSVGATSFQDTGDGQLNLRNYFLTVLRGVQGTGRGTMPRPDEFTYQQINRLLTSYGDFMSGLRPSDKIAILYSYTQDVFEVGLPQSGGNIQWERVFGTYISCLIAHYPATIIYEEDLKAGLSKNYKVIILTGVQVQLPGEVRVALEEFVKSGGVVLADKDTGQILKSQVSIPLSFGWHRTHPQMKFQWSDAKHFLIEKSVLPNIPVIREYLSRYVTPLADCENPQVFLSEQRYDKARYLFVANATRVPHRPQDLWRFSSFETTTLPVKEKLIIKTRGTIIYDIFSGKEIQPDDMKGNIRTITADMTILPGRIFAFLPERIASVSVETSEVKRGRLLTYRVLVLDDRDIPIDGFVPVEITIKDANGEVRYHLYRAVDKRGWQENLPVEFNDVTGGWHIEVTELLSGITAEKDFQVGLEESNLAVAEGSDVMVFGVEDIQEIFKDKSGEIILVVDESQKEDIDDVVERLIERLGAKGLTCKIITSSDYGKDTVAEFSYDGKFHETAEQVKSQQKRVIALTLGIPGKESSLINRINQLNNASRNVTTNYPGTGRGLIQYVFAPYRYDKDAILLYGGNISGLEKAVDMFFTITERKAQVLSELTQTVSVGDLDASGVKKSKKQLKPPASLFGIPLSQVAVSPDGGQIALGAKTWGNNLFVIDSAGKLLWKTVAGKWYPMEVLFTGSGQVGAVVRENDNTTTYLSIFDRNGKIVKNIPAMTRRHFGTGSISVDRLDIVNPVLNERSNDFSFSVSADWDRVASAGNLGVVITDASGKRLWNENFWQTYRTYDNLLNKNTANVALSPDGQKIAILKQKEYMRMEGVDSAPIELTIIEIPSGKVLWTWTFPPKQNLRGKILFFDRSKAIIYVSPGKIYALEDGKQRWECVVPPGMSKLAVCGERNLLAIGTKDGAISIMENGDIIGGAQVSASITGLSFAPDNSKLITGTADGRLMLLATDGRIYWEKEVGARASVAFSPKSDYVVAADWNGKVRRVDVEGGEEEWEIDLTPEAWRNDLWDILIKSDVQKSGVPSTLATIPTGKPNLARNAVVQVTVPAGWGSTGMTEHSGSILKDGKKDDIEKPWLNINEQYWSAGVGRIPSFTFWFPGGPQKVSTMVVYEHSKHPEAVPVECLIEIWKDDKWEPVKVEIFNSGVTHVHSFPEVVTTKLRYSIFSDLYENLWTTEVEIY